MALKLEEIHGIQDIKTKQVIEVDGKKELIKEICTRYPVGFITYVPDGKTLIERHYSLEDGKPNHLLDNPKTEYIQRQLLELERAGMN